MDPENQLDNQELETKLVLLPWYRRLSRRGIIISVIFAMVCGALAYAGTFRHSISVTNALGFDTPTPSASADPNYAMPAEDSNRLNILVLGIRGQDDPNADNGGPLLTDTIQVFSYDKTTHKSSVISLPRDLYLNVHDNDKDKINTIYEYGYYHSADPLQYVKERFSQISGVYIDKVVIFDFSSFKEIIDAVGGVDITLDKPFSETEQWGYTFSLPAGNNHLDGQQALYYARSRYSSSDFDRSRRQQQIMFALKDKLMKMNFFANPIKTFNILSTVRNDIKTDIGIWDIKQFLDLA
ncbi:MAG TPA: LCP family protein, partial [Candidatus Paceibacterota bacterium]|nr:LCP family protein [Candidatus Paceibacterota bacterium]